MGKYHVTVSQTGNQATSVVGDHTHLLMGSGAAASIQDVLRVLQAMRVEVDRLDLPTDRKEVAKQEVDQAMRHVQQPEPDKSALTDSLKNVAEIVKNSSTIALGVSQFWTLLRKVLEWAA